MPVGAFIKQNLALVAGIGLPVLMMGFFFVAAAVPRAVGDPPKYSMVFAVQDYRGGGPLPVSVDLFVDKGRLKARYARVNLPGNYSGWKKLYIYDAAAGKVRALPFSYPDDMDRIEGTREEVVEATQDMTLDPALQAPDGYELSYDGYSRGGLVNELFWGGGYAREPRLRKGSSSVRLSTDDGRGALHYGAVQFIGWAAP